MDTHWPRSNLPSTWYLDGRQCPERLRNLESAAKPRSQRAVLLVLFQLFDTGGAPVARTPIDYLPRQTGLVFWYQNSPRALSETRRGRPPSHDRPRLVTVVEEELLR